MQVGLKDYDPSKDKRFNGTIRLKYCPRPNLKICVLGNANHCEIGAQLPPLSPPAPDRSIAPGANASPKCGRSRWVETPCSRNTASMEAIATALG